MTRLKRLLQLLKTKLRGSRKKGPLGGRTSSSSGGGEVTNAGTFAVQEDGAALTALQLIDNFISGSRGLVTEDNSAAILTAVQAIQTAAETLDNIVAGSEAQVDLVSSLPTGSNTIGTVNLGATDNAVLDNIDSNTSDSASTYYDADLDETKVAVKASAASIHSIAVFNTTAAPLFLQLFNVASGSVTVGVTTPTNQYVIPGNADSDGAGFILPFPKGKTYDTALTIACTTDSEGSSAPSAGACIINIEYT